MNQRVPSDSACIGGYSVGAVNLSSQIILSPTHMKSV